MGQNISQYNPFTDIGRYNLNTYIYQNKETLTIVLAVLMFIVLAAMYVLYSGDTGIHSPAKQHYNIPPPRPGYGPYGYGEYLPPKAMLEEYAYG